MSTFKNPPNITDRPSYPQQIHNRTTSRPMAKMFQQENSVKNTPPTYTTSSSQRLTKHPESFIGRELPYQPVFFYPRIASTTSVHVTPSTTLVDTNFTQRPSSPSELVVWCAMSPFSGLGLSDISSCAFWFSNIWKVTRRMLRLLLTLEAWLLLAQQLNESNGSSYSQSIGTRVICRCKAVLPQRWHECVAHQKTNKRSETRWT